MPRFARLVLAVFALSGCAGLSSSIEPKTDSTFLVLGDEATVEVTTRWDGLDPYPEAVKYCAQYGRSARFRAIDQRHTTFDCLATTQAAPEN